MRALLAALAATLSLACGLAFAQQQCVPLGAMTAALKRGYHETALWAGRVDGRRAVLLTQSADGKTWTLMVVVDGIACPIGSGTGGHLAAPAAAD